MLQNEADAALVTICAAAFALEAFTRELTRWSPSLWRRLRHGGGRCPSRQASPRAAEARRRSQGVVVVWTGELAWLFRVRHGAVHYRGVSEPAQAHPVGISVSVAQVTYSPENATRAVDLLLGILKRCRDRPSVDGRGTCSLASMS